MSLFSAEQLTAGYGGKTVLRDLSFSVDTGRLVGVLGANGSGKTTLIKAICGILPHEGSCRLAGSALERLSPRLLAKQVSYIPQRSGISIDMTALDVVLMGFNPFLGLLEQPTADMRAKAHAALITAGLEGKAEENYLHLSEGQKQLCILARTLVASGQMLLLDEPESALDFRYRYRMLTVIRDWLQTGERCALLALHDPALALNFCDELLLLDGGSILGAIRPETDAPADMERLLSRLYGPVSLTRLTTRSGKAQLVMLKEEEDAR